MATIKIKFRPSSVYAKEGTLFYQVIHNLSSTYKCNFLGADNKQ